LAKITIDPNRAAGYTINQIQGLMLYAGEQRSYIISFVNVPLSVCVCGLVEVFFKIEAIMRCSNCGSQTYDSSCSCPQCGQKLHKCSRCNTREADAFNSKWGWACRECLKAEGKIVLSEQMQSGQIKCPVCGFSQAEGKRCEQCEVEFSKVKIACPACGEKTLFEERCSNCGVNFKKIKQAARKAKLNQLNYNSNWGYLNPEIICPHCQTKGYVYTQTVNRKKGISGTKATAALLTGGLSILATGLSRKEEQKEAYCDNCHAIWDF
jgi:hypothetical protein